MTLNEIHHNEAVRNPRDINLFLISLPRIKKLIVCRTRNIDTLIREVDDG
jgi:hypothetical protein